MTTDLDPRLWWVLASGGLVGWLVAVPLVDQIQKTGWIHWASDEPLGGTKPARFWPALAVLSSFLLVLLSIGAVILLSNGLSPAELLAALS
ncbi:MAG: hypothetical protein P8X64_12595, partial [Anaerolineales bacterium]